MGKKHYSLKTHHLINLVKYVQDEHGTLETHDNVPDQIHEQLYAEEQQRSRSHIQKGSSVNTSTGNPININILPTQPSQSPMLANTPVTTQLQPPAREKLKIRGPRDTAVRVYCAWQESNIVNKNLKANFQKARDLAISNGYNLEQVNSEQDPGFFVKFLKQNRVIVGIARRFVSNIRDWVEVCEGHSE
jgi:hypothetical protein